VADEVLILRKPYPREDEHVQGAMRNFSQYQTQRNLFASQWEETASLLLPTSRNTFYFESYNWQGMKQTDRQIDASGALALHRFCAIADSLVTPRNMPWHGLEADNEYLMKNRTIRLWYEGAVKQIFKQRYKIYSGFASQNYSGWQSVGAFGNATMFVDALDGTHLNGMRGLRYRSVPLGETFYGENHQGVVDRMIRWFRLTPYQAAQKWGDAALPPNLYSKLKLGDQTPTDYLHCVWPRDDYDPMRLDEKGMPFISLYISVTGKCMMAPEGGYRKFPFAVRRYDQTPGETYGRGPAQIVLPALKTLNAQKSTSLKQGHRAADPVLLTAENGIVDFSLRPGALNPGGVSSDGKPLVHVLPTGNWDIGEKQMEMEKGLIDDTFLVSLFKVLSENPNMTATQVIELVNEKGMLVAPTLGRQHDEYVAKMVEREVDLLQDMRLLDPMPPLLREAIRSHEAQHNVVDTSPLAKTARMSGDVGTIRMLETSKEIVNITQDMSYLDWFDGEVALPAMARNQMVPESYIADPRKRAAKAQARQKAQDQKMQMDSLAGQAAMINAQTKMQKAQPGVEPGAAGLGGPQQQQPQQRPAA
jgi:Bacteriophage head to tail connecting protein